MDGDIVTSSTQAEDDTSDTYSSSAHEATSVSGDKSRKESTEESSKQEKTNTSYGRKRLNRKGNWNNNNYSNADSRRSFPYLPPSLPTQMMQIGMPPCSPMMHPDVFRNMPLSTPFPPLNIGNLDYLRVQRSSPSQVGGIRRARQSQDSSDSRAKVETTTERSQTTEALLNQPQVASSTGPNKYFFSPPPTQDSRSSAPNKCLRTEGGEVAYPLIYVSPAGTISIILSSDLIIEMAVDKSIRIVHHNQFSAYLGCRGMSSSILHPKARIIHTKESVYCKFMSSSDKLAVFGSQGVLFTMGHLSEAYLVSKNNRGASAVALDQLEFPLFKNDYTLKMFYSESQTGTQYIGACNDIVDAAMYDKKSDGTLVMQMNGNLIRYLTNGDVTIESRPRYMTFSPSAGTFHVRSNFIDVGIQANEKAFVKKGMTRVHVSRSGMVVSDGNCVTSMDHFGRIVSCT